MGRIYRPDSQTFPGTADAVVIGGGIVGVATAFWLARSGLDTVLVEMRDGLSTLTSAQSIECFRCQFSEPAMAELAVPSVELYEHFADVVGLPDCDIALRHQGYLFVTDDEGQIDELKLAIEKHREFGVDDSEFLDGDELRRRFPYLSDDAVAGTYRARDGWLSGHEATQGFAKGSSAEFLLDTKVVGIRADSTHSRGAKGVAAVETTRGTISTRTVVNAAGPFAGLVAELAGVTLPVEPVRRQKVFVAPRSSIPQDAPLTIDLTEDAYWRPETGGAYIAWVDPDEPVAEPAEHVSTDWHFAAQVLEKLIKLSPFWERIADDLKSKDLHPSAGQYVYTPDEQPLIGPVPDMPGFHVNCGYWAGVMLAPEAGRRAASLITGELAPEDNPLRPTRYAEGLRYDSGSFLRGRHS